MRLNLPLCCWIQPGLKVFSLWASELSCLCFGFSRPKHARHVQTNHLVCCMPQVLITHTSFCIMNLHRGCSVFVSETARLSYVKPCLAMPEIDNNLPIRQVLSVCGLLLPNALIAIWVSATPRKDKHFLPLKQHLNFPQCRQHKSLSIPQPHIRT